MSYSSEPSFSCCYVSSYLLRSAMEAQTPPFTTWLYIPYVSIIWVLRHDWYTFLPHQLDLYIVHPTRLHRFIFGCVWYNLLTERQYLYHLCGCIFSLLRHAWTNSSTLSGTSLIKRHLWFGTMLTTSLHLPWCNAPATAFLSYGAIIPFDCYMMLTCLTTSVLLAYPLVLPIPLVLVDLMEYKPSLPMIVVSSLSLLVTISLVLVERLLLYNA